MSSTKRKAPPVRFARPQAAQSAKPLTNLRVKDAKAVVMPVDKQPMLRTAGEAIEISSDEEDAEALDGDDDDAMDEDTAPIKASVEADGDDDDDDDDVDDEDGEDQPTTNGSGGKTATKDTGATADDDDGDDTNNEPTFGDLVRQHETVDVTAALGLQQAAAGAAETNGDAGAVVRSGGAATAAGANGAAPTLASLGHLLNAALRSGDDANLEICFNTTTDAVWVRNTIQRLDPTLAGALLQKLAARIHRRPGRAHSLIGWVQWTLITHGGALLSNQPGVTRALQELHRVLEERARGLNSLLLLKGKLDMLEAQMQMRRQQRAATTAGAGAAAVAAVSARVGSRAVESLQKAGRGGSRNTRRRQRQHPRLPTPVRDGEDYVMLYREEWEGADGAGAKAGGAGAAGQILVNGGGAAVAGESDGEDDAEALDDDDDDDDDDEEEDDEDDEDGDGDDDGDLEEVDDEDDEDDADEDEVDFDDVDDDDDDDDDDDAGGDDDDEAAAAPPAKVQKKASGAFSKRR